MANSPIQQFLNRANGLSHLTVPIAAVVILLVLLVPLPSFLLDILISLNLMMSVVVLLSSMYALEPVKFTSFPNILLLTTLFRLALNLATSRLILTDGNTGATAAGAVIRAFGEFVIGGNYVVGVVIFLILLVIQFLVVNHGAVRTSEVTARFTLDAMPGKQMAVDADLAAGMIDENFRLSGDAKISARRLSFTEARWTSNSLYLQRTRWRRYYCCGQYLPGFCHRGFSARACPCGCLKKLYDTDRRRRRRRGSAVAIYLGRGSP